MSGTRHDLDGEVPPELAALREAATATKAPLLDSALAQQTQETVPALNQQVGGDHYKRFKIQPAVFCHANGIGFVEGNVIKYISRWRFKGGIADLKKARHMIDMLIELEEKE